MKTLHQAVICFALLTCLTVGAYRTWADDAQRTVPTVVRSSTQPVQTALKLLFASAGRKYTIDADVQSTFDAGFFPTSGSLESILFAIVNHTTPPIAYEVNEGVYHFRRIPPVPAGTGRITAVDTMKESRDTITNPLTDLEIYQDVALCATLHTTHITVDTPYDYPDYLTRWVKAVRATGRHVWFRCAFNAWEGSYDTPATMTPTQYTNRLKAFIHDHRALFQSGDILDPLPEPENGPYWVRTSPQGASWTWKDAPNATTDEYNRFFVNVTQAADDALKAAGIRGVITTIRSTNGYIAGRPMTLYPATVARMGRITIDEYVGQETDIAPPAALAALQKEVEAIENVRHVPLVLGEFGYSTKGLVSDSQQQVVLRPEFDWLRTRPYLQGMNYWHGAGYPAPDTYNGAKLFTGTRGAWTLRPAARDLDRLYAALNARSTRRVFHKKPATRPLSLNQFAQQMYEYGIQCGTEDAKSGIRYSFPTPTLPLLYSVQVHGRQGAGAALVRRYVAAPESEQHLLLARFTAGYQEGRKRMGRLPAVPAPSEAKRRLGELGLALLQYARNNNETLPPMRSIAEMQTSLRPYVSDARTFLDPISHHPYAPNPSLSRVKLLSIVAPGVQVAFYQPKPSPNGSRWVCNVDGHTQHLSRRYWLQVKAASSIP